MTARPRVVVFGSNVAGMLSALYLKRRGADVVLLTPGSRLGGHFGGLTVGGQLFDAGMTFLELTSFNSDPEASVNTYDPARRNDVGRFTRAIGLALDEFGERRTTSVPVMWSNGTALPDLMLANRLEMLRKLPDAIQTAMRTELSALAAERGPIHASRKATQHEFATLDFETVSVANHGRTFHDQFLEPFCRKVTSLPSATHSALYHRIAWLPLYYPETLFAELNGQPTNLPETRFEFPAGGSLASMVRNMEGAVRAIPGLVMQGKPVAILHNEGRGPFTLQLEGQDALSADHLIWAAESNQLLELSGERDLDRDSKGSIVLVSARVKPEGVRHGHSTMFIPESADLPFRITNQSYSAGLDESAVRISCEWNPAIAANGVTPEVESRVRAALVETNVVDSPDSFIEARIDHLRDVLPLATHANVRNSAARVQRCAELLPGVKTIGPSAPFGAGSLNDQVVQALQVASDPAIG